MNPAIVVKIKRLFFPDREEAVLHDIDLTIEQGDFVAVTGSIASGKSSLLHCITGAIPKFHEGILEGSVTVMGEDITAIPLPKMSETLGYMMQDPQNQMIDTKVYEDIAFGLGNQEYPKEAMARRIKEVLDFVGLAGFENRRTDTLSGGQAQRVVLGGVLAMEPKILVLDQPTAELDPKGRRELYAHLAEINREKGTTIVMVMDRSREVLSYANRILWMENGTITREVAAKEFAASPQKATASLPLKTYRETIISVENAGHTYKGGSVGCNPLNLSVKRGEFLAILGLNGSGKTTLLKMLEGLLPPTQGKIFLFGEEMKKKTASKLRERVGFLFQNPDYQIFSDTVQKEVTFCLKLKKIPQKEGEARGIKALESLGLEGYKDSHPQLLSRGQRQLLALSSILINEPDLIIADEPTSGLDEAQSHKIMAALREFTDQGRTLLLVTHDLTLAKAYGHRVVVMSQHDIVADFTTAEMMDNTPTLAAIGLIEEATL